jgi:hypothetical protein
MNNLHFKCLSFRQTVVVAQIDMTSDCNSPDHTLNLYTILGAVRPEMVAAFGDARLHVIIAESLP